MPSSRLSCYFERETTCLYGRDLCAAKPNDSVALDSGSTMLSTLGINSKWLKNLSVQTRSICSVLPDMPFLEEEGSFTRSHCYFLYLVDELPALWYVTNNISGTYDLRAYRLPFEPSNIITPRRPAVPDHSTSALILHSNSVQSLQPFGDPWFSSQTLHHHDSLIGFVLTDHMRY